MARNSNIYISSDDVGRDHPNPSLLFGRRLEGRFPVEITYGVGDVGDPDRPSERNPLNYGLVIFIVTSDQTRSPNWYRLQSELQKSRKWIERKRAKHTDVCALIKE